MKEFHGLQYDCYCPYCDHHIDAHTLVGQDQTITKPEEGDFGMCAYCNGVSVFDAHGKLRRPQSVEEGANALSAAGRLADAIREELRRKVH